MSAIVIESGRVSVEQADGRNPDLVRLHDGDATAVLAAYDAHAAHVRTFARRLLGDDAAAEDLVQDVFVTLPSAIKRYRGESTLRTFLVSIAINHARHHLRSATRRRAAMARFASEPVSNVTTPEQALARKALAHSLTRALDELPFDQRVAFVLCEVEERTSPEAALIANVPEATIRTRVFHARKKLQALLRSEGHHE